MRWIRIDESAPNPIYKQRFMDMIEECGKVCYNLAKAGLSDDEILEKTKDRMDKIEIAITNLDSDGTGRLMDMVETFFGESVSQVEIERKIDKLMELYDVLFADEKRRDSRPWNWESDNWEFGVIIPMFEESHTSLNYYEIMDELERYGIKIDGNEYLSTSDLMDDLSTKVEQKISSMTEIRNKKTEHLNELLDKISAKIDELFDKKQRKKNTQMQKIDLSKINIAAESRN